MTRRKVAVEAEGEREKTGMLQEGGIRTEMIKEEAGMTVVTTTGTGVMIDEMTEIGEKVSY